MASVHCQGITMIYPRYFFALCAVLLFAAVGAIHSEEQSDSIHGRNVEGRNSLGYAIRIIEQAFRGAKLQCIEEAAMHCRPYWNNQGALIQCAGNYLMANKVRCYIVG